MNTVRTFWRCNACNLQTFMERGLCRGCGGSLEEVQIPGDHEILAHIVAAQQGVGTRLATDDWLQVSELLGRAEELMRKIAGGVNF